MVDILMSEKEHRQLGIMEWIAARDLRLKDVTEILGISHRQVKRIRSLYRNEGDPGLMPRSKGQR